MAVAVPAAAATGIDVAVAWRDLHDSSADNISAVLIHENLASCSLEGRRTCRLDTLPEFGCFGRLIAHPRGPLMPVFLGMGRVSEFKVYGRLLIKRGSALNVSYLTFSW